MFQFGVFQSTETENQMISVERIAEYSKIKPEAPLKSPPGEIHFAFTQILILEVYSKFKYID
jgi:hypothetical protein